MIQLFKMLNKKVDLLSLFAIVFICATVAWAVDTKLSALTELAAAPATSDELYINDGGTSKKITVANLMLYLGAAHDTATELTNLFAAKEVQLDDEAGLYAVLSDVTQFYENGDETAILTAGLSAAYDTSGEFDALFAAKANLVPIFLDDGDISGDNITAAQCVIGTTITNDDKGGAVDWNLPDCAAVAWTCTVVAEEAETVVLDSAGGDTITLFSGAISAADAIDSDGNAGSMIVLQCREANQIFQTASVGLWIDGGAD